MSLLTRVFTTCTALVTLPPRFLHEATHAALAAPHAQRWEFQFTPHRGHAAVVVAEWHPGAPRWGVWLAHLGPLLAGILLGILALGYIVVTGRVPATVEGWLYAAVAACYWGIYTAPSHGDLDPWLHNKGGGE